MKAAGTERPEPRPLPVSDRLKREVLRPVVADSADLPRLIAAVPDGYPRRLS